MRGPVDLGRREAGQAAPLLPGGAAASFLERANDEHGRAKYPEVLPGQYPPGFTDFCLFAVLHGTSSLRPCQLRMSGRLRIRPAARSRGHDRADGRTQAHEMALEQTMQFFFSEQWGALRSYCAISEAYASSAMSQCFVSYDSADVWTHPRGVRPERPAAAGARVGRAAGPLLLGDRTALGQSSVQLGQALAERGFGLVGRSAVRRALMLYDVIRLDHFRKGFEAFWLVHRG